MKIAAGEYTEDRDGSSELVQRALVAAGGPMFPPKSWYEDPKLDRPTPITVTADGQIKGHIAPWTANHIGLPPGTRPPRNATDYQYFKTGVLRTDDGEDVTVGQLTLAGGHAPMSASAEKAVAHYDDTASAVADVTIGEDAFGIWINGGLRPDITDGQIRALRASAPSGDWRPIDNSLELVAICQVNTPGFPVARAMVASGGELTALVAAGASDMYSLQQESALFEELARIHDRIDEQDTIIASFKGKKPFAKGGRKFDEDKRDEDDSEPQDSDSADVRKDPPPPSNDKDDDDAEARARLRVKFRRRQAGKS